MRTVSIISALSKSTLPFVDEAYESIKLLTVPEGFTLKWYIQHDGDSEQIQKTWFDDERVSYEYNGRHLGAAGTRNQALLRTDSEFVISLDSDDLFKENALVDLLKGFETEGVAWAAGAWHELHPDGTVQPWRSPLFEGVREVGWVYEEIMRLDKTPFSMNPILYKRQALVAAGGWPAFPEWEDTILLTVVSGRHKGWATDKLVGLYRRHENSYSKSEIFQKSKPTMYRYIKEVGRSQSGSTNQ